jgi:hypothetical protein
MEQLLQVHPVFELAFKLTFYSQVPVAVFKSAGGFYIHIQVEQMEDRVVISFTVYKKEFGREFKQIFRLDDQGRCQYTACVWAQNPLSGQIELVESTESFTKERVLREKLWHNTDKPASWLDNLVEILEREDTQRLSPLNFCVIPRDEQTGEDAKVMALSSQIGLVAKKFERFCKEQPEG